jgi:seryl-tRNA synthetase
MLDIRFIRENPDLVQEKAKQKGYDVDINQLLGFHRKRSQLLQKVEELRRKRNELSHNVSSSSSLSVSSEAISEGRILKDQLADLEHQLKSIGLEYKDLLQKVPNIFPDDTPIGDENANREEKRWGETKPKDFKVIDHLTWGEQRGFIDFERGAKVAGKKFYYLKGSLVELELAVFQLGIEMAKKHGFIPISVPHLVNTKTLEGAGFSARGNEKQIYKIEDEDLNLIATAEIPMTGYLADETLDKLPKTYVGLSPSYRVESGAYGKYNRGLFRTHQFNKLELYVFCRPEESGDWHQKMVALEEEFCQALEIPYRVVRIASRDLGSPAYKKYDIEYYSPVDDSFRELTSCSNVTDYQARRLNIRFRSDDGQTKFVHTLNGTLAAASRIPIAIIENHQSPEGKVRIPDRLREFMHGQTDL